VSKALSRGDASAAARGLGITDKLVFFLLTPVLKRIANQVTSCSLICKAVEG
jgi:hypothetical protein